jgi:signal peptidase I
MTTALLAPTQGRPRVGAPARGRGPRGTALRLGPRSGITAALLDLGQALLVVHLLAVVLLLAFALMPAAVGWRPQVVLTGSMRPALQPGAVVVTAPPGARPLAHPSVITFAAEVSGPMVAPTVTHRVVETLADEEGVRYRTQGDANRTPDRRLVAHDEVAGVLRLVVPFAGAPSLWRADQPGLLALWALTMALGSLATADLVRRCLRVAS